MIKSLDKRAIEFYLYESGRWKKQENEVVVESLVSLTVNGENWFSFLCTPVELEAMAIGFLYNESIIKSISDVASIRVCPSGDNIDVWLHTNVEKPNLWRRTSGCTGGITSVEFENVDGRNQNFDEKKGYDLTPVLVSKLVTHLNSSQLLYRRSGGIHTSAICDNEGIIAACEDIGRHNTLDKLAGRCMLDGFKTPNKILITTGRISSEMMQKAYRMGIIIVISRTSPTSLSVQLAERWGITLIGYANTNRFRVYSHSERILIPEHSNQ